MNRFVDLKFASFELSFSIFVLSVPHSLRVEITALHYLEPHEQDEPILRECSGRAVRALYVGTSRSHIVALDVDEYLSAAESCLASASSADSGSVLTRGRARVICALVRRFTESIRGIATIANPFRRMLMAMAITTYEYNTVLHFVI